MTLGDLIMYNEEKYDFRALGKAIKEAPGKTSRRRRIDSLLDELDDTELIVMEATAKGIKEAKEAKIAAENK